MRFDTVLCIWRIINALWYIRSTVILLFFLWVGELVLFKTNINKLIYFDCIVIVCIFTI